VERVSLKGARSGDAGEQGVAIVSNWGGERIKLRTRKENFSPFPRDNSGWCTALKQVYHTDHPGIGKAEKKNRDRSRPTKRGSKDSDIKRAL